MTELHSHYFPLHIELDYAYSLGQLTPYFEALSKGLALASACPKCGRVIFPPRRLCDRDGTPTEWLILSGQGQIVELTQGFDARKNETTFALISMDGAHNMTLGRIEGTRPEPGNRVQLRAKDSAGSHPATLAFFSLVD